MADLRRRKAHDDYHRFFRAGAWCMAQFWERLAHRLVARFHPQGVIPLTLDDTTYVLCCAVSPKAFIRLVISRDPQGHEEDDCLFTTD